MTFKLYAKADWSCQFSTPTCLFHNQRVHSIARAHKRTFTVLSFSQRSQQAADRSKLARYATANGQLTLSERAHSKYSATYFEKGLCRCVEAELLQRSQSKAEDLTSLVVHQSLQVRWDVSSLTISCRQASTFLLPYRKLSLADKLPSCGTLTICRRRTMQDQQKVWRRHCRCEVLNSSSTLPALPCNIHAWHHRHSEKSIPSCR